jgi:hypothetical protein
MQSSAVMVASGGMHQSGNGMSMIQKEAYIIVYIIPKFMKGGIYHYI